MKKAGIIIDSYKLDTFKKYLAAGGFTYGQVTGPVADTLVLTVQVGPEDMGRFRRLVSDANAEAFNANKHH